jgi:p-cymene methyl-monooxygenase electron transfer component
MPLSTLFGRKAPRTVEISPLGARIEVPPGKTILEAALAEGLDFPHDCTVGTCGTCKSRLLQGRVESLSEFGYTLSAQELAANFILPCQSMPRDPLVRIELISHEPQAISSGRFAARIVELTPLTHDIVRLELELDRPIRYLAGQYANLMAPSLAMNGGSRRARSYSFAEPPQPAGSSRVAFFVRKVAHGAFTEALFAGDLLGVPLQLDGPHGGFHLREGTGPIVCVAGGSGLAPILSMLLDAARRPMSRPCILLFGARTARDLYMLDQIEELRSRWMGSFTFVPVLSHEPMRSDWTGARGLVTDLIADMPDFSCAVAQGYLCGPPGMIDVGISSLTQRGAPLTSIFYDKFTDASHGLPQNSPAGRSP